MQTLHHLASGCEMQEVGDRGSMLRLLIPSLHPHTPTSLYSIGSIPLLKQTSLLKSFFWMQVISPSSCSSDTKVLTAHCCCQPLGYCVFFLFMSPKLCMESLYKTLCLLTQRKFGVCLRITNIHLICIILHIQQKLPGLIRLGDCQ